MEPYNQSFCIYQTSRVMHNIVFIKDKRVHTVQDETLTCQVNSRETGSPMWLHAMLYNDSVRRGKCTAAHMHAVACLLVLI